MHFSKNSYRSTLDNTLDEYFEEYERGNFPTDEELTEWSVE